MIEDEELGLKVAENEEEAFWERKKQENDAVIEATEGNLKLCLALKEVIEKRLDEASA